MSSSLPRINSQLRPIIIHGHKMPLTAVKYNADGDLLFSAGKDRKASVYYADTGARLGSYSFHKGAVWDVDPSWDSQYVATACGDANARIFRTTTGACMGRMPHNGSVRAVKWSEGNSYFATASDPLHSTREQALISIFELSPEFLASPGTMKEEDIPLLTPKLEIRIDLGDKGACIEWTYGDEYIIVGTDSGHLIKFDPQTGAEISRTQVHKDRISRISFNADKTMLITASKDHDSKLIDPTTLGVVKVYHTENPVNAAVMSPTHPHILMGGGQEAMNVTTTAASSGKFESKFFHMLYEEEFGRVKGHFGPINAIAVHPAGISFASGSEDGYIRLHPFDAVYLNSPSLIPEDVPGL